MKNSISIVVSTYNSPEWLQKVIWGYQCQNFKNFELIVADDGSDERTQNLILELQKSCQFPLIHVWHEDNGFQKTKILNKAALKIQSDYVVFTDGDCIPRNDFLETHLALRERGMFLSGGYHKLPMSLSQQIDYESIVSQHCFDVNWLKQRGMPTSFKNNKLKVRGRLATAFNLLTPTKATWNGSNASCWTDDLFEVNGFDERMQYGGEDREFGERLNNKGVQGKQVRYSAICVHLDHTRGYVSQEYIEFNNKVRQETVGSGRTWAAFGIKREK